MNANPVNAAKMTATAVFGAGVEGPCEQKGFWMACDAGVHGDRLPQRQRFPGFGAGVEGLRISRHLEWS